MTRQPTKTPVHHAGDGVIRDSNPDWENRPVQTVNVAVVDRIRAYMAEDAKIDTAVAMAQLETSMMQNIALLGIHSALANISVMLTRMADVMTRPDVAAGFERQVDRILTNLERSDKEEARREVDASFDQMILSSNAELAS